MTGPSKQEYDEERALLNNWRKKQKSFQSKEEKTKQTKKREERQKLKS